MIDLLIDFLYSPYLVYIKSWLKSVKCWCFM